MRPIALSKNKTVPYVLDDNRGDEPDDQVVWKLRALPFAVRREIMSTVALDVAQGQDTSARIDTGRRYERAVRWGLDGWENLTDGNGNEITATRGPKRYGIEPLSDESLALIPDDYIIELGDAIIRLSASDAETVGK